MENRGGNVQSSQHSSSFKYAGEAKKNLRIRVGRCKHWLQSQMY